MEAIQLELFKEVKNPIKTIFTIDKNGWILIDTEKTWRKRLKHVACVSLKSRTVSTHSSFFTKDSSLPKITIKEYLTLSSILKERKILLNKKTCEFIDVEK